MNLAQTISIQNALEANRREPRIPESEMSANQIADLVFKQADEKEQPFLYMEPEDWRRKWLASKRFTLMRIPIAAAALPCDPKDRNWVLTVAAARRTGENERPIIVDFNKREVGRAPAGYIPPVIVIDGKHRHLAATMRGESHILAWVGDVAAKKLNLQPVEVKIGAPVEINASAPRGEASLLLYGK